MGKPSPGSVDNHLQKMSSTTAAPLKTTTECRGAAASTAAPGSTCISWTLKSSPEKSEGGVIPKFLIQKVSKIERPTTSHQNGEPKLVDGLIKRWSLGRRGPTDIPQADYAAKEFRKRSSSSSLGEDASGPKVFVVDNSEQVPGMLQTPIIDFPSSCMSVFKSKKCDSIIRKYRKRSPSPPPAAQPRAPQQSLLRRPNTQPSGNAMRMLPRPLPPAVAPQTRIKVEDIKVEKETKERPKVKTPPIDVYFRKPRTVAEKRLFLDQSPIEYKILDNENTIYHLIKKVDKYKADSTFRVQVELLMYSRVPMNRNIYRAMLWLNQQVECYRRTYLVVDGQRVLLSGALNMVNPDDLDPVSSEQLYKPPRFYRPEREMACCWDKTLTLRKLKNEEEILEQINRLRPTGSGNLNSSPGNPKKLLSKRTSDDIQSKPAPLSVKVRRMQVENQRVESHLGPLEIYDLPVMTITAAPELCKKQPKRVCSYLKLALPDQELTKEWLDYSLSVLQPSAGPATTEKTEGEKGPENTPEKAVFHFPIPYKNDQRKILVRRVMSGRRGEVRRENYDRQMKYQLTFPQVVKDAAGGEGEEEQKAEDATVEQEVTDILTEMIDSVAMSFSQDYFTRDDPDLSYCLEKALDPSAVTKPTVAEPPQANLTIKQKRPWSRALKAELSRLNVTIIDTAKISRPGICKKDECRFGCICESISKFDSLVAKHCPNAECIFECKCHDHESPPSTADEEAQRLFQMRDEKISRLARMEKDFTSTLVLTNSDTILMRNSLEGGKRRSTKPKRYSDFAQNSSSDGEEAALHETIPAPPPPPKKKRWHPSVQRMVHCAVALPEIPSLGHLEQWCMVHELYYCFCRGRVTEGRRFKLKALADGTVKSNARLSSSLHGRRPMVFAKNEAQDALERIPERPRPEYLSCSRCTPRNFAPAFHRNRKQSGSVRLKLETAHRGRKQQLLEKLVEQCVNHRPLSEKAQRSAANAQQKSLKRLQMVEEAGNELGLKITSVRSLNEDEAVPAEEEAGDYSKQEYELRLKALKKNVLVRLNSLLSGMGRPQVHLPQSRQVDFVRFRDFTQFMRANKVYEVWRRATPMAVVMCKADYDLKEIFPPPTYRLVDIAAEPVALNTHFYMSRFLVDRTNMPQSSHIYVVVQGSGRPYWYLRGCQYIRDPQKKIRILPTHTDQLKEYARTGGRINCPPAVPATRVMAVEKRQREQAAEGEEERGSRAHPGPPAQEGGSNLTVLHFHGGRMDVRLPSYTDKRYVLVVLQNDFSDMSHPSWKGLLSYTHIRQALKIAHQQNKTIKVIRSEDNLQPNIFATPQFERRIFAGPFDRDAACELTLYQRLDNSLYLREEYEQMLGVQRVAHTQGFWLTSEHLSRTTATPRRLSSSSLLGAEAAPSVKMEIVEVAAGVAGEETVETASGAVANVLSEIQITPIAKSHKSAQKAAQRRAEEVEEEEEEEESEEEDVGIDEEEDEGGEPDEVPPRLPQISLTKAAPPRPILPKAPTSCAVAKSLLKPKQVMTPSDFVTFADMLRDSKVATFKVGNTVIQRYEKFPSSDGAIAGPSTAPDPPAPAKVAEGEDEEEDEGAAYQSEEDDCLLVEDPTNPIIDLDEWERVQQECSGDEDDLVERDEGPEGGEGTLEAAKERPPNDVKLLPLAEQTDERRPAQATEDGAVEEPRAEIFGFKIASADSDSPIPQSSRTDSIPLSGYYKSNIPALGFIPAKILNGLITMNLPFRKMPIKIGWNCIDRYMLRYIQNVVSACIPENLDLKWEFVNSYFPKQENMFMLEPTNHRNYMLLTPYGVLNAMDATPKTEEEIPDPVIYLKYLAARLCCVVFDRLGSYNSETIIHETLQVIKKERYQMLKNTREISELREKQIALKRQLKQLIATSEG